MKYNEFILKVQSAVQEKMGNGYEVKVQKVTKNNGIILDGLSIHKWTANMAPTIYLNTYYEQLGENMTLAEITADVVSIYHENPCILLLLYGFGDCEQVSIPDRHGPGDDRRVFMREFCVFEPGR